jgi:CubicO group peptidase (beta-lactamase class C family)
MHNRTALLAAVGLALVTPVVGLAQAPANTAQAPATAAASFTGEWSGSIKLPTTTLDVEVTLAAGPPSGTIDIPKQNAKGLKLINVSIAGRDVAFTIDGVPGEPTFKGSLTDDGAITGVFTQAGQAFPFTLTRKAAAKAAEAKATADTLAGFDEFVEKLRDGTKVPGLAVGIVRGQDVIYSKGFGFADVEAKRPVTTKTLFAIGSSTKAFTTAVMGALADEGKLEWDAPVQKYIPEFNLAEPELARRFTPVDLVTHRSGLPRHDLLWYNSTIDRAEIVRRLPYLPLNKDLREAFQYNNLMYATAGVLIDRVSGSTWEAEVTNRLLKPLKMSRTNLSVKDMQADADAALPYQEEDDQSLKRIPYRDISNVGPAGSINSSVEDMLQWAKLQLSDGTVDGVKVLTKSTLDALHTPRMVFQVAPEPNPRGSITIGYALGWFVEVYRGHAMVHHGGNIDGFTALVTFFPADNLAMVVLANKNGTNAPDTIVRAAADRLLKLEPRDWLTETLTSRGKVLEAAKDAKEKKTLTRIEGTQPTHPLADYLGDYTHPGYGTIRVAAASDPKKLRISYNGIAADFEHWHYDVFSGTKDGVEATLENMKVQFLTSVDGEINALRVTLEPSLKPSEFSKGADATLSDPALLARLVGQYTLRDQVVTVSLQGNTLQGTVPGQPTYTLVPQNKLTFGLKGLEGYRVRFVLGATGPASEAIFLQPNGNFAAKRKPE